MRHHKAIRFILFLLALIYIQPVMSFENETPQLTSVSEQLEDVAFFKSKSSKALVYHEFSITKAENPVTFSSVKANFFQKTISIDELDISVKINYFLLDFRSILSIHIFPFHFFL